MVNPYKREFEPNRTEFSCFSPETLVHSLLQTSQSLLTARHDTIFLQERRPLLMGISVRLSHSMFEIFLCENKSKREDGNCKSVCWEYERERVSDEQKELTLLLRVSLNL
jgi:hypothetical protein